MRFESDTVGRAGGNAAEKDLAFEGAEDEETESYCGVLAWVMMGLGVSSCLKQKRPRENGQISSQEFVEDGEEGKHTIDTHKSATISNLAI